MLMYCYNKISRLIIYYVQNVCIRDMVLMSADYNVFISYHK